MSSSSTRMLMEGIGSTPVMRFVIKVAAINFLQVPFGRARRGIIASESFPQP